MIAWILPQKKIEQIFFKPVSNHFLDKPTKLQTNVTTSSSFLE